MELFIQKYFKLELGLFGFLHRDRRWPDLLKALKNFDVGCSTTVHAEHERAQMPLLRSDLEASLEQLLAQNILTKGICVWTYWHQIQELCLHRVTNVEWCSRRCERGHPWKVRRRWNLEGGSSGVFRRSAQKVSLTKNKDTKLNLKLEAHSIGGLNCFRRYIGADMEIQDLVARNWEVVFPNPHSSYCCIQSFEWG